MTSNSKLNVTATLNTLLNASKNWEDNSRKTSNATLYSILADCLRFYEDMLADVKARKELNTELDAAKITYTAATDLVTKIVRYVFRTEAKRVFVYVRVLKIAHEQKIAPLDFAAWVEKHDGIDAISRLPKGGVSPAAQKQSDKSYAEERLAKSTAVLPNLKLPADYLPSHNAAHDYCAAILRKERDGTVSIVYAVNNEAILSSMLVLAGRKLRSAAEVQSKRTAEQQQAAAIEVIAREAIAQLRGEVPAAAA
jgi:hypothetical protein